MGKFLMSNFLKAWDNFDLSMMSGRSNSPNMLEYKSTDKRSFEIFSPIHVSFLNAMVLSGTTLKNNGVENITLSVIGCNIGYSYFTVIDCLSIDTCCFTTK